MFVLHIPLLGPYHKLKNILVKDILFKKIQLALVEKSLNWNATSKKEDGIALNKDPQISPTRKGEPKKQSP